MELEPSNILTFTDNKNEIFYLSSEVKIVSMQNVQTVHRLRHFSEIGVIPALLRLSKEALDKEKKYLLENQLEFGCEAIQEFKDNTLDKTAIINALVAKKITFGLED